MDLFKTKNEDSSKDAASNRLKGTVNLDYTYKILVINIHKKIGKVKLELFCFQLHGKFGTTLS